jgi:hypothetical protein
MLFPQPLQRSTRGMPGGTGTSSTSATRTRFHSWPCFVLIYFLKLAKAWACHGDLESGVLSDRISRCVIRKDVLEERHIQLFCFISMGWAGTWCLVWVMVWTQTCRPLLRSATYTILSYLFVL